MKIALVVGRSFEGAGVTRYVIELESFLRKKNIEHTVFDMDDKKWPRRTMQAIPSYENITKENISNFHDILNKFDYVFIHSVPSVKHSQWAIDGFLNMLKNTTAKKIVFQNDHKIASIWRNANFFEICNISDGIVSFSVDSPFYKKLIELYGENIKSKFIQLNNGFNNFDDYLKYRNKEDFRYKKITYLGRFATFKQPERLFAFLPYTQQNNLLLEMKGVERSLGALHIFYGDYENRIPHPNIIEIGKKTDPKLYEDNLKRDLSKIYIFGPYVYEDGMKALSTSLVGADFYHLNDTAYGNSIEYALGEIVGVGAIPMLDYGCAENCYTLQNGKPTNTRFLDLDTYGLYLKKDLSNVEEVVEKINEIYSNKTLHKKYQDCSYEVTKEHFNGESVYSLLLENIQKIQKHKVIKQKNLF